MAPKPRKARTKVPPPIYIVSGGSGASGEQLVETALAQFPDSQIPIYTMADTRRKRLIREIVTKAARTNATIVHTLVDPDLREALIERARDEKVVSIDLMGPVLERLAQLLKEKPRGQPGLYRQLRRSYFDRIEAIEFAMAHDDGKGIWELPQADIVLTGVSRSGKTPLSMYLGVLGWKVANIPVILDSPVPAELFQIDRSRVFALDIDDEQLVHHRRKRQQRRRQTGPSSYTDPKVVNTELETARTLFRKHRFTTISVTNKPIETSADEIIEAVTRRFGARSHTD